MTGASGAELIIHNCSAENSDRKCQNVVTIRSEDCQALVAGNSLNAPLTFKSGKALPTGTVRLRFILFEAELFAFYAE